MKYRKVKRKGRTLHVIIYKYKVIIRPEFSDIAYEWRILSQTIGSDE